MHTRPASTSALILRTCTGGSRMKVKSEPAREAAGGTNSTNGQSINGYPKNLILRHFNEQKMPNKPKEEPKTTVVLPYIRHLLEGIRHILSRLNIRTCFKPLRTLRNVLVHPKDRIPMLRQKGVVYRIQCQDCGSSYIGHCTLEHRVKEHKRAYMDELFTQHTRVTREEVLSQVQHQLRMRME